MKYIHKVNSRSRYTFLLGVTLAAIIYVHHVDAAAPVTITLGQSLVNLNGPWKFHTGDDPAWSNPNFDDSAWESLDLTAPPGAHDQDVGLSGYVSGWEARGHRGYSGYAWYRLRIAIDAPPTNDLALAGPAAVDSAYQVFINGQLLGGCGKFSGSVPKVFSIQPRIFAIPRALLHQNSHSVLIAFRVWMGPWDLAGDGGGMRIAPALGEAASINERYQMQWLEVFRGYIVEVVEATIFMFLAVMSCTLIAFARSREPYVWLAIALLLTALYRANQAIFFWGQFETVYAAELISIVLLVPLCLAAWTLAWRAWFRLRNVKWMPVAVGLLTVVYIAAQFLTRWWFHSILPPSVLATFTFIATATRLAFLALTVFIIYRAIHQHASEAWITLPAVALVSIGQFAQELSALGLRSIWFPYGAGVSRTQFAYAAFDAIIFALLLRHYLSYARREQTADPFLSTA